MYHKLLEEGKSIAETYRKLDKTNYTELFLILKRVNNVYELCRNDIFDREFRHILRSANLVLESPPTEVGDNNDNVELLKRELDYLCPHLNFKLTKWMND